jgi:sulfite reductase beta subunit-like hemoprotein
MKTICVVRELGGGGSEVMIVPVPCRGTVHSVRVASNLQIDANGTLKVGRGDVATAANVVNTVTGPAGNTAAGTILDGVKDADYGDNVFDPDSDTAAYKSMWIEDDATFLGGAATVVIRIEFDDSAYIEQEASEA